MKLTTCRLGFVLAAALTGALATAQGNINVSVDGKRVQFTDMTPREMNGRVLVPLRGVFEEMGANVEWNAGTRSVTAIHGDTDVRLRIGDRAATINGRTEMLDVPAMLIAGRTMVPLRFVSEALGADVQWMAQNREVLITTARGTRGTGDVTQRETMRRDAPVRLLAEGTVIPVVLNDSITSDRSRAGDVFTATVQTSNRDSYGALPTGTKVEGSVVTAKPQQGNDPGIDELAFKRIILPDGRNFAMNGSL
ncbi:MAG TPA: stalk domain-containing protein, partial [Fimbriimonadaceae bacterium]|nr:stalk domain-containing protein [Fimbriimonadaceae bacterium]